MLRLLDNVISSFHSTGPGKGLPLGNLTSQLLANIYLNAFDQFAKHRLKARRYIRYADDFAVLSGDRAWLLGLLPRIGGFLREALQLELHPDKVSLRMLASGVDFLGWVHFPDHRVLRTAAKRRMMRRVRERHSPGALNAYFGLLAYGNVHRIRGRLTASLQTSDSPA